MKGFERTSIQDLCDELGIHRGSLFDAFGDKQQLFLACLERYGRKMQRELLSTLAGSDPVKTHLERFITRTIDLSMDSMSQRGCFLVNTMIDYAPFDTSVAAAIESVRDNFEGVFYDLLIRAEREGEPQFKHHLVDNQFNRLLL